MLVATLVSNANTDVDPGFLVDIVNIILDCHPSVSGDRTRRSTGRNNQQLVDIFSFFSTSCIFHIIIIISMIKSMSAAYSVK